jgi:hypothetical protein
VANAPVWLPVHHQIAKAAKTYKNKVVSSPFSPSPDILLGISYLYVPKYAFPNSSSEK